MKTNQWIILIVAIIIMYNIWTNNKKNDTVNVATIGKYSEANNYKNITPMKHDIYKQLTIDLTPLLLLNLVSSDEFFSINNFEQSAVGKSLLSGLSYVVFYQLIQPYIVNRLPNF
jgi:hypothetical protein